MTATSLDRALEIVESLLSQLGPAPTSKKGGKKDKTAKKKSAEVPPPNAPTPAHGLDAEALALFQKSKIGVGAIRTVEPHPTGSEKLWVLTVDVGEESPKHVCAGLRPYYPDPAVLINRPVAVVLNLKAAKLGGVLSEAMLLAASNTGGDGDGDGDQGSRMVRLLSPPAGAVVGQLITLAGVDVPTAFNATCKVFNKVAAEFVVQKGEATYRGVPMVVGGAGGEAVGVELGILDGASIS